MDKGGRPTKLTQDVLDKCKEYVEGGWQTDGSVVPSIAGMCVYIGVSKSTIHNWARNDRNEQFLHYYEQCQVIQEGRLINSGLNGDFAPAITKMLLSGHGHSDKVEQNHTSSDGSMSPQKVERTIVDAKN